MNKQHLEYCSSDEWADAVKRYIIPAALEGVELGDEVLEVGPGPGRSTEVLQSMTRRMTAAEIDVELAHALAARLREGTVRVVNADGTALPFASDRFTAALSFTMLKRKPRVMPSRNTNASCRSGHSIAASHIRGPRTIWCRPASWAT